MNRLFNKTSNQGFTLVELSIVIIIIGFIIAGIAAGTSLIEQARLNSVVTDLRSNQVAYFTFISKYNAVPGDMDSASTYWPTTCATTSSYCNGDGNGRIYTSDSATTRNEERLLWKHLSLAGLISLGANVIPDDAITPYSQSYPVSKIAEGGYYVVTNAAYDDTAVMFNTWLDYRRTSQSIIYIAKANSVGFSYISKPRDGVMTPSQAFAIDQKLDDATTSNGDLIGASTGLIRNMTAFSSLENCNSGNVYNVNVTSQSCLFGQILGN